MLRLLGHLDACDLRGDIESSVDPQLQREPERSTGLGYASLIILRRA